MENNPTKNESLEQIVQEQLDSLYRFAYFRVGSRQQAEDIVQEVFLKLFSRPELLRGVENIHSYLLRALSNRCCDHLRRRRPANADLEKAAAQCVEEEPEHREWERINDLLDRLPEEQAEVIRLRTTGEMSFDSIAAVVGCPTTTVKSRFRYGIEKLRKIVNH